ncbi:hypothetical protein G6W57_01170 [Streptomyces sp. CAI-121]|uniref:hypothetical protein n=1 Tax=unclassified Streptomyces TaxID=2593676 RepID=UPI001587C716|nr:MULTISPECIES: hypothetical protein [unclassified Streptomyces]NUV65726.1 hypothetical protein [Streptomyces sp. CAI-121]NUW12463.1 hypothetical protein [Streptomyces sp. CAI-68]
MTYRTEYIAGIRAFADWLENNPAVAVPGSEKFLLPLHTNPAVEEFAAKHSLAVAADSEGNESAEVTFGPIAYQAYGYVDFNEHLARNDERNARRWAEKQGLEFRRAEEEDSRDRAADVADEVAAEDGHRFVGVPFQRKAEAA